MKQGQPVRDASHLYEVERRAVHAGLLQHALGDFGVAGHDVLAAPALEAKPRRRDLAAIEHGGPPFRAPLGLAAADRVALGEARINPFDLLAFAVQPHDREQVKPDHLPRQPLDRPECGVGFVGACRGLRDAGDVGKDRGIEPGLAELAKHDGPKLRYMKRRRSESD